jgi:SAM-dependent methyltransferase
MEREFSAPLSSAWSFELWPMRALLFRAISARAGQFRGRLLDYGCGTKPYRELFTNVRQYVGVEVNAGVDPSEQESADIYFDGLALPLATAGWDGVVAFEVLEHVPDLPATIGEIARVMKPGGLLLATTPFVWPEHEAPHDYARWSRFSLQRAAEGAGLEVVELVKLGNAITVIAQIALALCVSKLVPHKVPVLRSLARAIWCAPLNALAFLSFSVPSTTNRLYLGTLLLARKRDAGRCR